MMKFLEAFAQGIGTGLGVIIFVLLVDAVRAWRGRGKTYR